ncbi:MAG: ribonuclease T [Rhodobacterales bacterium]|nr:MAG: ribonuclease T [Rhodobacterales bacterium]
MIRLLSALLILIAPLARAGGTPGEFDYYVLSLSWSPNWCRLEGRARNSPQCDEDFGWVLHGLWPQYERGWPSQCQTAERNPSRADTAAQADLFGSSGSAWHQWNKHGRCSGLSSRDYYRLAAEAYARITRPEVFRKLTDPVSLPAGVVEEAFLKSNPDLSARGVTVTCKDRHIQEVRICLTRDLEPRDCGVDVMRDCALSDAYFAPIE